MFLTDPTLFFNANTDASAAKELINTNIGLLDSMMANMMDVGAIKSALEDCNIDTLTDKIDTTKEDLIRLDDNFATQYMTLIQESLTNSTFNTEDMSSEELATYNSLVRDYDTTLLTMLEKYESEGLLTDEMKQQLDYQRAKVARYDITDQMAVLSPSSEGYLELYEKCAEYDRQMIKFDPNLTEEERTTALANYETNYNNSYSSYKQLREDRVKFEQGMKELEQLEKEKEENNGWFHPILENEYKEKILDKKIELGIASDAEIAYKNMDDWGRFWTDTGTFCASFVEGWGKLGENIIDATVTTVGAIGGGSTTCSNFVALDLSDMGYKGFVKKTGMNEYSAYSEVHDTGYAAGKLATKVALSFTAPWFNAVVSGVSAMGERAEEGFQNGESYYEAFGHSLVSGVVGAAEGYANSKMNLGVRNAFSNGTVKNALTSAKNFFTGAGEGTGLSLGETWQVAKETLKPSLKNALKSTVMDADIWVDTGSIFADNIITGVATGDWDVGQMFLDAGAAALNDFGTTFAMGYGTSFMSNKKALQTALTKTDDMLTLNDFDSNSVDEVFDEYTKAGAKVKYIENDGVTFAVVTKDGAVLQAFDATGYKPSSAGGGTTLQVLDGGGEKRALSRGSPSETQFRKNTVTNNNAASDTTTTSSSSSPKSTSSSSSFTMGDYDTSYSPNASTYVFDDGPTDAGVKVSSDAGAKVSSDSGSSVSFRKASPSIEYDSNVTKSSSSFDGGSTTLKYTSKMPDASVDFSSSSITKTNYSYDVSKPKTKVTTVVTPTADAVPAAKATADVSGDTTPKTKTTTTSTSTSSKTSGSSTTTTTTSTSSGSTTTKSASGDVRTETRLFHKNAGSKWEDSIGRSIAESYGGIYGSDLAGEMDEFWDYAVEDMGYDLSTPEGRKISANVKEFYRREVSNSISNEIWDGGKKVVDSGVGSNYDVGSYVLNDDGTLEVTYVKKGTTDVCGTRTYSIDELDGIVERATGDIGDITVSHILHLETDIRGDITNPVLAYDALNEYNTGSEVLHNMTPEAKQRYNDAFKTRHTISSSGDTANAGFFITQEVIDWRGQGPNHNLLGYQDYGDGGPATQWAVSTTSMKETLNTMDYKGSKLSKARIASMSEEEIYGVVTQVIAVPEGCYDGKQLMFVGVDQDINVRNMTSNSLRGANNQYGYGGRTLGNTYEADIGLVDTDSDSTVKFGVSGIRDMFMMLLDS